MITRMLTAAVPLAVSVVIYRVCSVEARRARDEAG
jgi:hypothetical protein